MSKLVIVESPTKAKTIKKFLGKDFSVESSFGHIRDLPEKASKIPAKYKDKEWAKIGVNYEDKFQPIYVTPSGKQKVITKLKKALKKADELYLATDEDREGESISYHLTEVLKPKVPVKRMVFHEITKSAIDESIKNPRDIDEKLVEAQETRRVLDRLVGYTVSPVIWKKIKYGLSAGRVQSAGLRLLVEKERERIKFKQAEYWDILAELSKENNKFEAKLTSLDERSVATGKDFDGKTGKLKSKSDAVVLNKKQAEDLKKKLEKTEFTVSDINEKEFTNRPYAPYITSTLQQDGYRRLGMSARQTMSVAQKLYERGFITYMRTDSPALSKQALNASRGEVKSLFGKKYLSKKPKNFSSKSKSAQEAHEAIRPAHRQFIKPSDTGLSGKEFALYTLIWKRTLASQMTNAKKSSMKVSIKADNAEFTASGTRILFPGFLQVYIKGDGSKATQDKIKEDILPEMKKQDTLDIESLEAQSHETKPPSRYNEASLVKKLEKLGIGRPSTYATIIHTIQRRNYAQNINKALVPTFTGFAVVELLENHFSDLVDYEFTSEMEQTLDKIAEGKQDSLPYLKNFYLGDNGLKAKAEKKIEAIDPEQARTINIAPIDKVKVKVGRYGPYIEKENSGKENTKGSIPEDITPDGLSEEKIKEILKAQEEGPKSIGKDPKTGKPIYVMLGRYGPYVQLGEADKDKEKPRRASIPKDMDYQNLELKQALKLLSLPKVLGKHPDTGKDIVANIGRYGPYVVHDGDFRSLKEDDVYEIELDRALEIFAQEKKGRKKSKKIKDLGKHPKNKKNIAIYDGRYGPYLKYGKKNVSLPDNVDAKKLKLEKAVKIIQEKEK